MKIIISCSPDFHINNDKIICSWLLLYIYIVNLNYRFWENNLVIYILLFYVYINVVI